MLMCPFSKLCLTPGPCPVTPFQAVFGNVSGMCLGCVRLVCLRYVSSFLNDCACPQDGFVLVGSVAGQRYWSSNLRLSSNIVCGTWTPDDQQVSTPTDRYNN